MPGERQYRVPESEFIAALLRFYCFLVDSVHRDKISECLLTNKYSY